MAKKSTTELISLRVDPKVKYFVELAGREQRRTITSYVEKAIMESLIKDDFLKEDIWDVSAITRLLNLANDYKNLLTYEELITLKFLNNLNLVTIKYPHQYRPNLQYFELTDKKCEKIIDDNWDYIFKAAISDDDIESVSKKLNIMEFLNRDNKSDDEIPFVDDDEIPF